MSFPVIELLPQLHKSSRPSKWSKIADEIRETPGELQLIAQGLSRSSANSARSALLKRDIQAWVRTPEDAQPFAVIAGVDVPEEKINW